MQKAKMRLMSSSRRSVTALALLSVLLPHATGFAGGYPKADGYRGVWYSNEPTKDEYVYKYSGGLGTYCMKHIPMAIYAAEVRKTFFVYGGASPEGKSLLEMVSYYDHRTGQVPRPTILMDKRTEDAHDNPVLALDTKGYVWVFASSHGTARPSYLFKSKQPYDIEDFDRVWETNFSYPQPFVMGNRGFLFLHTRYGKGRGLFSSVSADGFTWSTPKPYAKIEEGHYQVSWPWGDKVGTAFDYHPKGLGLNFRTNLYYLQTYDLGETWQNAAAETVRTPVTAAANRALVHDFAQEGLLVYVKDLAYDENGNPTVLFVTSKGWKPGPAQGPHHWRIARWRKHAWTLSVVTASDNNYDSGSLYAEGRGHWRIIGPTEPGPQPYNPGGEVAVWRSSDDANSWRRTRLVTHHSRYNHSHVRRPMNAHPDFYAFWADGDTRQPSESSLFFCNRSGKRVCRLPEHMTSEWEKPAPVRSSK